MPPVELEIHDALQRRLNTENFLNALRQNSASENLPTVSCMLTYSTSPIPTSLIRMNPDETQVAVEVFGSMLEWMQLTKGFSTKERREEIVQEIIEKTADSASLRDELYLQHLKQTRGNVPHFEKKNVWRLLEIIVPSVACSEGVAEFVLPYVKSVAFRRDEEPMVRMMAFLVYDAMKKDHPSIAASRIRMPSKWHISGDITAHQIQFADGSLGEIVYDAQTLVSDGIRQAAWLAGIRNWECYTLALERDVYLARDARLGEVLKRKGESEDAQQVKLYFEQILFCETKTEMDNPDYVQLSYSQLKRQYLHRDFFIADADALKLCVAQLLAEHGSDIFHNHTTFPEEVSRCIPKTCFARRKVADWAEDAHQYFSKMGRVTQNAARQWFLALLQDLQYGESVFFGIQQTGRIGRSLKDRAASFLVLTPHSADIFTEDRHRQVSVNMGTIISCEVAGDTVELMYRRNVRRKRISMKVSNPGLFCELVRAYCEDAGRGERKPPGSRAALPQLLEEPCQNQGGHSRGQLSTQHNGEAKECPEAPVSLRLSGSASAPCEGSDRFKDNPGTSSAPTPTDNSENGAFGDAVAPRVGERKSFLHDKSPSLLFRRCTSESKVSSSPASMGSLATLAKGDVFANCYSIKSERVNGKAHVLFAEDINTGASVVLKFYTNRILFENSIRNHRELKHSEHVCKMLAAIDDCHGYLPCLVFEKGQDTLEEWMKKARPSKMDRRCVLSQILAALVDIHSHRVVHCDLKPSNIMFFTAVHKWKLIDFDSAIIEGQPSPIHATQCYAAPEIIQAVSRKDGEIALETSADMWSFGVIAFEVLKGTRFFSPGATLETILESLNREKLARTIAYLEERQERSLVKAVINLDPKERATAAKANTKGIFDFGLDSSQIAAGIGHVVQMVDKIYMCTTLALSQIDKASLAVSVDVEAFTEPRDPCLPFHLCQAAGVFTMADDCLPNDPIFVLNYGQQHRLRISFMPLRNVDSPLTEVLSVEARLQDGSKAQLKMSTEVSSPERHEVVALLDPASFEGSDLLNTASPTFGYETTKYVAVEIITRFSLRAASERISDLKHTVYCKMVAGGSKMYYQKFKRVFDKGWRTAPQWMRDAARVSFCIADVMMNVA